MLEYYSAFKKKGILPFATKQLNLEDINLQEARYRKTNTACSYLYEASETLRLLEAGSRTVVAGDWVGRGKWRDAGQKAQFQLCKIKKFWRFNVQHGDYR